MKTFDARRLADEIRDAGVVVVGSGVAGLTAALGLAPRPVTILSKSSFGGGGSSPWAQGGVAVAVGAGDSPRLHALDTLSAAAGLAEPAAVSALTEEGPQRVRRLVELGTAFDRGRLGELKLGREAAHRRRRVLHAHGDATGAEIVRALVEEVRRRPEIGIREHAEVTDLVLSHPFGGRVVGVLARERGRIVLHRAAAVILATGGFGQIYLHTTNPRENTGDGLAMAARAGARLADLEFVQFHPTALDMVPGVGPADGGPLPLVTEALRGEGATIVDQHGVRFLSDVHPDAELAPRDVVARGLFFAQEDGRRTFLDAREAVGDAFPERFPTVWEHCRDQGLDPRREPIPVTPAAHYSMAGVAVDLRGRASLDGLWACGEVASTGVHGANRLASNSLLEALVFGERVAKDVARSPGGATAEAHPAIVRRERTRPREDAATRRRIRELAWRHVGLVRDADGLERAAHELAALASSSEESEESAEENRAPGEVANLLTVARLVTAAAAVREESRGGHYRADFPEPRPTWRRRLLWTYRPERDDLLQPVVDEPARVAEIA